jgi:hypothetical protein
MKPARARHTVFENTRAMYPAILPDNHHGRQRTEQTILLMRRSVCSEAIERRPISPSGRSHYEEWSSARRHHRLAIPGSLSRSRDRHDPGRYVGRGGCSPTASHAKALADRYKISRVYSDYKELAGDPAVEAVSITAPNVLHCEMAVSMAQAGKHVICEKPLCVTLNERDLQFTPSATNVNLAQGVSFSY